MARLLIGTSGWTYGHWRGPYYPLRLASRHFLEFYSREFATTELNYSFYHVPRVETYRKWADLVPASFTFAIKANRLITHLKRLETAQTEWRTFVEHAQVLGQKLGPILVQLPPSFPLDHERLHRFLDLSDSLTVRLVFEFRHDSWFVENIYRLLYEHGVALCIADSARRHRRDVTTADFTYLRYHGRARHGVAPCYTDAELAEEARIIARYMKDRRDVFVYFNNDAQAHAVSNAKTLKKLCQKMGIDDGGAVGVRENSQRGSKRNSNE